MTTMEIFKKNQEINNGLMEIMNMVQPSEKKEGFKTADKVLNLVTELCAELIDGPKKEEK